MDTILWHVLADWNIVVDYLTNESEQSQDAVECSLISAATALCGLSSDGFEFTEDNGCLNDNDFQYDASLFQWKVLRVSQEISRFLGTSPIQLADIQQYRQLARSSTPGVTPCNLNKAARVSVGTCNPCRPGVRTSPSTPGLFPRYAVENRLGCFFSRLSQYLHQRAVLGDEISTYFNNAENVARELSQSRDSVEKRKAELVVLETDCTENDVGTKLAGIRRERDQLQAEYYDCETQYLSKQGSVQAELRNTKRLQEEKKAQLSRRMEALANLSKLRTQIVNPDEDWEDAFAKAKDALVGEEDSFALEVEKQHMVGKLEQMHKKVLHLVESVDSSCIKIRQVIERRGEIKQSMRSMAEGDLEIETVVHDRREQLQKFRLEAQRLQKSLEDIKSQARAANAKEDKELQELLDKKRAQFRQAKDTERKYSRISEQITKLETHHIQEKTKAEGYRKELMSTQQKLILEEEELRNLVSLELRRILDNGRRVVKKGEELLLVIQTHEEEVAQELYRHTSQ